MRILSAMACAFAALGLFVGSALAQPAERKAEWGTVILVGFDGFRWDTIDRYPAPHLRALADRGVRASMRTRFPSITFPNFYAMATGLNPESSGVVSNAMYDPELDQDFGARSWTDSRWWGGEPIWATLQRQGGIAGVTSWIGSEAGDGWRRPMYNMSYSPFAHDLGYEARLAHVFRLLDLPAHRRPQLVTLYHDEVDVLAQDHGLNTPEEAAAVARHDALVGALVQGLAERGLLDSVHIVVVGDHGMVEVGENQTLFIDDFLAEGSYRQQAANFGASLNIWPVGVSEAEMRARLERMGPGVRVYGRDEIPEHFHNRDHRRTPPLLVVAEEGWKLCLRDDARCNRFRAIHGYDNALPSMNATFIAAGPRLRSGARLPLVDNIDVYPLLAELLGVRPAPNDADPCAFARVLQGASPECPGAASETP